MLMIRLFVLSKLILRKFKKGNFRMKDLVSFWVSMISKTVPVEIKRIKSSSESKRDLSRFEMIFGRKECDRLFGSVKRGKRSNLVEIRFSPCSCSRILRACIEFPICCLMKFLPCKPFKVSLPVSFFFSFFEMRSRPGCHFLLQCVIPRVKFSIRDAYYCTSVFELLMEYEVKNFSIVAFLDGVLKSQVSSLLSSTEKEVSYPTEFSSDYRFFFHIPSCSLSLFFFYSFGIFAFPAGLMYRND